MKTPLTNPAHVPVCASGPAATDVYARFREPQQVICPEKGEYVTVQVDAEMAAATAAVGVPGLRIIRCTQWPRGCGRGCLDQLS